jgi:undecaprenyl diphosphate synthase
MSHLLYRLYERRLRRQIRAGLMPEHVGLILDGNRRYARKQGFTDPGRAYEMGAQKLDEVLLWCNELGIPAVTLWVCSTENLKRPHAEVSEILGAVEAKTAFSHLTSKGGLTARNRSAKVLESLDPALTERRVMTSKNGSCDNARHAARGKRN